MNRVHGGVILSITVLTILLFRADQAAAQCRTNNFSQPINSQALNSVGVLTAGDFNNDGRQDLVIGGANDFRLSILLGNGDGTLGNSSFVLPSAPVGNGNTPEVVAAGDLNNDGILDLAISHRVGLSINIALGQGDGSFSASSAISLVEGQITGLAAKDLNGDGNTDLVASVPPDISDRNGHIIVILNQGGSTFGQPSYYNPDPANSDKRSSTRILGIADMNGDNIIDLVAVTSVVGASQSVRVIKGQGDGTFNFEGAVALQVPVNSDTGIYDVNSDGKLDIVIVDSNTRRVTVRLSRGDGGFGSTMSSVLQAQSIGKMYLMDLQDFNADGRLDLAVKNIAVESGVMVTKSVLIYLGRGNGRFNPQATTLSYQDPTYSLSGGPTQGMIAADFNGDNRVDLAAGNYMTNKISIRLNGDCQANK